MQNIPKHTLISPHSKKSWVVALAIAPAPIFLLLSLLFPDTVPLAAIVILVSAVVGLNLWMLRTPCHTCGRRMVLEQFVQRDMTIGAKCNPSACAMHKPQD